jgi:hypothetical protein
VNLRTRIWLGIAGCVLLIGASIWLATASRPRPLDVGPAAMLARLPAQNGVVLWVDADVLRRGGFLKLAAQSKVTEEPEYQAFVRSTGFDYKSDLDAAAVSFHPDGDFFVVRGKFDWGKLRAYAKSQGGSCYQDLCRLTGSSPNRNISFLPLASNLMALAVSSDAMAAARLKVPAREVSGIQPPSEPVWLSVPAATLRKVTSLPGSTGLFAKAMENSDRLVLSLGPDRERYEVRLEVTCRGAQEATALSTELERITSLLREAVTREKRQPDPNDLSGVLTAGVFQHNGRQVMGRWPLAPGFLEALAGGMQ